MSRYHSASRLVASGVSKWWYSPSGETFEVTQPTHERWISDNKELLKDNYGVDLSTDGGRMPKELVGLGWGRMLAVGGRGMNAEILERSIGRLENFLVREFPQLWRKGSGVLLIINNVDVPARLVQEYSSLSEAYRAAKWEHSRAASTFPAEYPLAGDTVSGLRVTDDIPNMSSIPASMMEYEILDGVREVPMSHFPGRKSRLDSKVGVEGSSELAREIEENGWIDPLIVGIEADALDKGPYILEGAHRFDALAELGKPTFPAMVATDTYGSMPTVDPRYAV